jgi:hypothetical protein
MDSPASPTKRRKVDCAMDEREDGCWLSYDLLVVIARHIHEVPDLSYFALASRKCAHAAAWVYEKRREGFGKKVPREYLTTYLPLAWSWHAAVTSEARLDEIIDNSVLSVTDATVAAAAAGRYDRFWYLSVDKLLPLELHRCAVAAAENKRDLFLEDLAHFTANLAMPNVVWHPAVIQAAARRDRVSTLTHLYNMIDVWEQTDHDTEGPRRPDTHTLLRIARHEAARTGALKVYKCTTFSLRRSIIDTRDFYTAIRRGHLQLAEHTMEVQSNMIGGAWSTGMSRAAIRSGRTEVTDWLLRKCAEDQRHWALGVAGDLVGRFVAREAYDQARHAMALCPRFSVNGVWEALAELGGPAQCDWCLGHIMQGREVPDDPYIGQHAMRNDNLAFLEWVISHTSGTSGRWWFHAAETCNTDALDLFYVRDPGTLTPVLHRLMVATIDARKMSHDDPENAAMRSWLNAHQPT